MRTYKENSGVLTRNVEIGYDPSGYCEGLFESMEQLINCNFRNPREIFSDKKCHHQLQDALNFGLATQALVHAADDDFVIFSEVVHKNHCSL